MVNNPSTYPGCKTTVTPPDGYFCWYSYRWTKIAKTYWQRDKARGSGRMFCGWPSWDYNGIYLCDACAAKEGYKW